MNHTERRAPVVPGQPRGPRGPVRRLLRVVRHRRALRGRPRHLRRHRAVQLDVGPGAPAVLLAPVLPPPARPQLRQPQGPRRDAGGDGVLARHGPRRVPARRGALPLRAPRHQRREPPRDPRLPQEVPAASSTTTTPAACCSARPTSGRPTWWSTSVPSSTRRPAAGSAPSATWPSTSPSCRASSWPCAASRASRSRRSSSRPRRSPTAASGASSCATTTSSPSRWSPTRTATTCGREYAQDPRMKANIGIRRRLAPLLDNDVNRMELFTALLLSLPGSPVLYYGDEIGMGDNIWLGDRDGVRTPMQWTPDRNAGFSVGHARQAAPAGDPGPGLRLPVGQRRGAAGELLLAAALDPAAGPRPAPPPGLRARRPSPTSAAPTRRVLSYVREHVDRRTASAT